MVAGQAAGEPLQVLEETALLAIDAQEGIEGQGIVRRGMEAAGYGIVPEEAGAGEVGLDLDGRGKALKGLGDTDENGMQRVFHGCAA